MATMEAKGGDAGGVGPINLVHPKLIEARKWVQDHIERARELGHTFTVFDYLDEYRATALLEISPGNRGINYHDLNRYARDVVYDVFVETGDTIGIGMTGEFYNGHHRCEAVLKVSKPIPRICFMFGQPPEARFQADGGRRRSNRDQIQFDNELRQLYEDNIHDMQEALLVGRMLEQFREQGKIWPKVGNPGQIGSRNQEFTMAKKYAREIIVAQGIIKRNPNKNKSGIRPLLTAITVLLIRAGGNQGAEFMKRIVTGVDMGANSAELYLHNFLQNKGSRVTNNWDVTERFFRCWNKYVCRELVFKGPTIKHPNKLAEYPRNTSLMTPKG